MSDVTVARSAVYPGRFRVRVIGSDGGELIVSREQLRELVTNGREVLEHEDPRHGAAE